MPSVSSQVQVHMPFRELHDRYLSMVLARRFNPEISFDFATLERFRREDYQRVADQILDAGLSVTFHAPFMDLRPGALDPQIRQVSINRIREVFDLVPLFHPRSVVCHASFDHRYYVSTEELWLQNSVETWTLFIRMAEEMDTTIALENVYEKAPYLLDRLLQACGSPRMRFCFDTGHFNVFSGASLDEWIQVMAPHLFHLHLHDNGGTADEHLAVGQGSFPFSHLFRLLQDKDLRPIMTMEAHREETLWQSLKNLETMGWV